MQVTFTGILKANIPSENTAHLPIAEKYKKAGALEDVLNGKPSDLYTESQGKKLRLLAKKTVRDYKEPNERMGEDYNKEAGIYRLTARDAIYYCTGSDIESAKNLNAKLRDSALNKNEKQDEIQKFVSERAKKGNTGFFIMDSADGDKFDIIGMGAAQEGKPFSCDFIYL